MGVAALGMEQTSCTYKRQHSIAGQKHANPAAETSDRPPPDPALGAPETRDMAATATMEIKTFN
ncbi:hypothetical protein STA1M1_07500 [Sinisalibacter aestuarii]|uniref:Uncharacterized protein n=1 Tax=Sinisalibacter aestuarii TaxID=2949426 RepID=A0ABQ5LPI9_9RHOB|nr:hypothetical protein STA1M1_07500 [Sinisalibacter aestuarii]